MLLTAAMPSVLHAAQLAAEVLVVCYTFLLIGVWTYVLVVNRNAFFMTLVSTA